jgi:hypothetical protein
MKHFLALLLLAPVLPLAAQQPGIEQSSNLLTVPAGDKFLQWYGHADRSYFLQVSDANNPLAKWFWAPVIEAGNDEEISYEVDGTASKGFFRLLHTTLPQPPGVTLEEWDADDDRLHNWEEITTHGSNPLKSDTDDDGLPDDWEIAHGLNALDDGTEDPDRGPDAPFSSQSGGSQSASAFAAPESPLTNSQAFGAGVRAVPGATLADKDGDLIPDVEDADPLSLAVNWRKSPKPVYIAVPVQGWSSTTHSFPLTLNNQNSILTAKAVYQNGQWSQVNGYYLSHGQGPVLSYKFLIEGRLHNSRLGQCIINSISDQGIIVGTGKILIDSVTTIDPATGEPTTYAPGYSPDFAMIWRNPQALPEIFGVAPGSTFQGARHFQAGMIHRDGTVLISQRRPEDIFVNNHGTLQRWPNSANGGGVQTSPIYTSPGYSYPAAGGTFAFGSSLDSGQFPATLSWVWPATLGPQSLYSVTRSAPGAPALNFQSFPTTIGTAPSGEVCINLSGQVLVGHSSSYHQVQSLQGATKISSHGAALLPGTFGNPVIWYGGSTYSLSSCVANPQALGTTLTVRDMNDDGSMLAIVNVSTGSQRLVILLPVEFKTYPVSESGPDKAHKLNLDTRQNEKASYGQGWEKCVSKVWATANTVNLIDYLDGGPGNHSVYENAVKWKVNGTAQTSHELSLGSEPSDDSHRHYYIEVQPKSGGDTIDRLIITLVPRSTKSRFDSWYTTEKADLAWLGELVNLFYSISTVPLPDGYMRRPCRNFNPFLYAVPSATNTRMHPDAYYETRSYATRGGHAHQMCFDDSGILLQSGVSAGSADKAAAFPQNINPYLHVDADVKPFVWALQLDGTPADQQTTTLSAPIMHEGAYLKKYSECRPTIANSKPILADGVTP